MRVTFLLLPYQGFPTGGAMVLYEYANRLSRRGHQVTLVHSVPPEFMPFPSPDGRLNHWFSIDSLIEQGYFSVIDSAQLPSADILLNGAYFGEFPADKGRNVLLVQGSGILPWEEEVKPLRKPGPKLCVSEWLCGVAREAGSPADEVIHLPNGVDHSTFHVVRDLETRPHRIAMLYNGLAWKGGDIGIDAVERLKARMPDLQAVFFGVLPRPPEIPPWVDYRHLPSRRSLALEIYNSAAVFLCPSRTEGFYLCGLEALASGCAFASTDVGGVRDYAEHDVTALVSPIEDPEQLACNAARLLSNLDLRLRLARAGHARALLFDWEVSTDEMESAFRELLRRRPDAVAGER